MQPSRIFALVLMGGRPEPFLPAMLKCLDGAVDHLVVHDNSGQARSANREVLEKSAMHAAGRVSVCEAPFVNFSQARNETLDFMRRRFECDANTWLLLIDCDEVHPESLSFVTRRLVPSLPPQVGVVDAYFFNFILSFDFYNALDRRHNLIVRYNEGLHWTHDVHEQLHGIEGRRLCLPHTFHHYGYIRSIDSIVAKWQQYRELGDGTYSEAELLEMGREEMFLGEVDRAMYYGGTYPAALEVLGDPRALVDPHIDRFRELVAARLSRPVARVQAGLRDANYRLRLWWRAIQWLMERRRLSDARGVFSMLAPGERGVGLRPQRAV